MASKILKNIKWYIDLSSKEKKEPGIVHSYMASLATAINYKTENFDPAWLMGTSGFAFRIWINEIMCPSAMSIFDFNTILPEAIEQVGYHNQYINRLWDEGDKEEERRLAAHRAIINGIEDDCPSVVWDVEGAEWGLIIGYNDDNGTYSAFSGSGKPAELPYEKLGRNGIDILSVATPTELNERSREEIIINSLKTAVAHCEQREWTERPKYENGLLAYDMWTQIFDRWALLVETGKTKNVGVDLVHFARYYSSHYASARCYARDYLCNISNGNENLKKASASYEKVSSLLKKVWIHSPDKLDAEADFLRSLFQSIKDAKSYEEEGIAYIKEYLKSSK
jgi:hypothetical protein